VIAEPARYSRLIRWSERDRAYLVALPEWEGRLGNRDSATHGDSYREAAENGPEVLEMLVADALESGESLPEPRVFAGV
jgi:predicted RNase H-like HicB family nuclease